MITERKTIEVVDLLLDPKNFRIGTKNSQTETREAIIAEQGKKLLALAVDVVKLGGFSPYDLPLVYPSVSRDNEYIMLEGNRRLLVLKALLNPELMLGSDLYDGFFRLHEKYGDNLETSLFCAVATDRKQGLVWVARKHQRGLEGAGTEDWNPVASDRFDAEMGIPTPNLDAMDFVRHHASLSRDIADKIDTSKFPITTLGRLLGDEIFKQKLGLSVEDGKLKAKVDRDWVTKVLGEVVTTIAMGAFNGEKFNVRSIDDGQMRERFADQLLEKFPKPSKQVKIWVVDKDSNLRKPAVKTALRKVIAKSTNDRETLIPKDYRLKLPEGKVNDIFHDLRKININAHPNAIAVELRVFVELSIARFMDANQLKLPGNVHDSLINLIKESIKYIKKEKLMATGDLKGIEAELGNKHSFVAPNTLNAYVHNPTFSAKPEELKITWNRLASFMAILWKDTN